MLVDCRVARRPALDHVLGELFRIRALGLRDVAHAAGLDAVVDRHDDAIELGIVDQVDVGHFADLEAVERDMSARLEARDRSREVGQEPDLPAEAR